jgi:hypothetical protein
MLFRKKDLRQNIPFRERILPFGDFLPKSQRLASTQQHNWQAIFWIFDIRIC